MSAGLPLADPQFWIVSLAAGAALVLLLRRLFKRPKSNALPCASCPKAGKAEHVSVPRSSGGRALLLAAVVAFSAAGTEAGGGAVVEREVAAMGTRLSMSIAAADRPTGLAVSAGILAAVEDAERRLSTWGETSELLAFNRAPSGSLVEVSPFTWRAVEAALACWQETGGAFDPTVAPLVEVWGLRDVVRPPRLPRLPSAAEIAAARELVDAGRLEFDRERLTLRQPGGLRFEEGGFGKGAGLDAALAAAAAVAPSARVDLDFGGQLAWSGHTQPFVAVLADPRDRTRAALELTLDAAAGSLSTSGNSERSVVVDGVRVGHLLDPRTGRPARDIGSATVLAGGATAADCRSTGLYVLGETEGAALAARWSRERQGEAVLLLVEREGLRALITPGLAARARALVPDLRIETISGLS